MDGELDLSMSDLDEVPMKKIVRILRIQSYKNYKFKFLGPEEN